MIQVRWSPHEIVRHHAVASRKRRSRSPALTATLALMAMCVAAGCGGERGTSAPTAPTGAISPVAQAYLDELIALMEPHSVNRLKIDWNAFRSSVVSAAGAAQSAEEAFPAIRTALMLLGDGHSFYEPVKGATMSYT
ncbi:MAG: hypothetical protein ACRDKX_09485 [Solirubrobacterales bacterium]